MTMVMIPVTIEQLRALAHDGRLDDRLAAIAVDDALADEFGVAPGEEAEAAALQLADVLGLATRQVTIDGVARRQVLVAEVPAARIEPAGDSAVVVPPVWRRDVLSFYTGDCAADLVMAAGGLSLDAAWELPGVQAMLARQPLAWHDVSELGAT